MASDRIGVGLIGVGRHGLRYARHIVNDLPTASLRAVCRQRPEQGFDLPGAQPIKVYGKAESLIVDPAVDVVIVVTPPLYVRDICRLAVQARKPVLIEKPLATTVADAGAMVTMAREAAVPLMTAHTLRFDNAIQQMKTLQYRIGRSERLHLISRIEKRKTAPGHADGYGKRGALLEIGVHMLDLVRFLTFLQAVRENTPMPITGEDGWRAVEIAEACYQSAQLGGAPVTLPISI